jgi:rubrerythrin
MDYQDILTTAMDMEIRARDDYQSLAQRSINEHAGKMLRQLASEEQKHLELLREFADALPQERRKLSLGETVESDALWQGYVAALDDVRESILAHTDELTTLQKAKDLEQQAEALYRDAATAADDEDARDLFAFLAGQEARHVEFVSKLLSVASALHEEFPEARPDL